MREKKKAKASNATPATMAMTLARRGEVDRSLGARNGGIMVSRTSHTGIVHVCETVYPSLAAVSRNIKPILRSGKG